MNRTTIIMALVAIALTMPAAVSAADWQQFQKDKVSIGWVTDSVPIYDPAIVWSNSTGGTGHAGVDVVPIVAGGRTFVLNSSGWLHAFNATTGGFEWKHDCTPITGGFELSTPAYNDGIVYVATSAGNLSAGFCRVTALHAINGSERENKTLKTTYGYQLNTPVTYADGRIYVGDWNGTATATSGSGTYWCLNASNVTQELWNYTPNRVCCGYFWAGAAIVGDYIIFGDDTTNVTCLYNNNGTFVDYINISEKCGCSSPVEKIRSSIAWNESTGRIYFTAGEADGAYGGYGTGHVYAVAFNDTTGDLGNDGATGGGACEWNNSINFSRSTPAYYDGRIYVGGAHQMYSSPASGKMCCLHETNGTLIWQWWHGTNGRVQASPAVSVVNGRKFIYFTTNAANGSAYCLEDIGDNYTERWEWNPPAPDDQYILQGMSISNGTIYFGTDYGIVYALQDHFDIHIWKNNSDPKNLFAVPLKSAKTTLAEFVGSDARSNDKVYIYSNTAGYKSASYLGGGWMWASNVEPIGPGVGYEYHRIGGGAFTITNTGYLLKNVNTPIYGKLTTGDPKNLIGYATLEDRNLSAAFGASPVANDKVYRYFNGVGYRSASYIGGGWMWASNVEPIMPGVGYEYNREGQTFSWNYDPYNV